MSSPQPYIVEGDVASMRLIQMVCGKCHIPYAMPETKYNRCINNQGESFYCPNGHGRVFTDTTVQKLRRELDRVERDRNHHKYLSELRSEQLETEQHRSRAYKGEVTKIKKRVSKGICPCCHRSFVDLARHMNGQHPDYVADHAEGVTDDE